MKLINKTQYKEKTKIIDIQVKDSHNFSLCEGKVIAHNSYLRPRGAFINGVGVESPGAIKFMELFDKSSEIITAGSGTKSSNKKSKGKIRKGAQMSILNCFSKNTDILTEHGWMNVVELINLLEDDVKIKIIADDNKEYLALNPITKTSEKIVRVETVEGNFIEVTENHEFEVFNMETEEIYLKAIKDIDSEKELLKIITNC